MVEIAIVKSHPVPIIVHVLGIALEIRSSS